jgi:hypothetical protein
MFESNTVYHVSRQENDVAFATFEKEAMLDDGMPLSSLPGSHLPVLINLLAMSFLYFTLRQRGKSGSLTIIPKMFFMTLTLVLFPMFLIHARIGHVISSKEKNSSADIVPRYTAVNENAAAMTSDDKGSFSVGESQVAPKTVSRSFAAPLPKNVACPIALPVDTRIMLLTVVQAFHGSTALASVLMSSPEIATYCSGKTWQCEGFAQARKLACPLKTKCLRDERQLLPEERRREERRDFNLMDLLSFNWNLTRPILHDKLFPREPGYTDLWKQSLERSEVSPQMKKVGIRKVLPAYIIMWTPLCVMSIQKRSRTAMLGPNARNFLQTEIWNLQRMKQQHEALLKSGIPVLVISYADLLFREAYTLGRMNEFLPCAGGKMNVDFIPRLGVDVFPENRWKVRGTVHEFSAGLNPTDCCGYDVMESKCQNRTYFELIREFEDELNELDQYFSKYSS